MTDQGRCAFHTNEGLCSLQLICGENALPNVCRTFPRKISSTLAAREYALSPACEGVLALLWDLPEGIDFVEEPLDRKDWVVYKPDTPVTAQFADIRSFCIDILQERSLTMPQRLLLTGFLFQQFQSADWQTEGVVNTWLSQGKRLLHNPAVASELDRLPQDHQMFISNNLQIAARFSNRPANKELGEELLAAVTEKDPEADFQVTVSVPRYKELEYKLEELLGHSEYFFENLMVSTVFLKKFPNLISPEELWKDYVRLCNTYSFFRFAAVCGCDKEVSRERLFYILVAASRALLHNSANLNELQDELFQNDSATLAHMAILVGG